jgi:hypothetical protein
MHCGQCYSLLCTQRDSQSCNLTKELCCPAHELHALLSLELMFTRVAETNHSGKEQIRDRWGPGAQARLRQPLADPERCSATVAA